MASAMAHNTLSVVSILSEQLTAVFVDVYGEIIETLLKQPKDAHKPHRIAMILSSTTVNQEVSPLVRLACSRWRRCVLLARIAYK